MGDRMGPQASTGLDWDDIPATVAEPVIAVGTQWQRAMSADCQWRLMWLSICLVTSSTIANRRLYWPYKRAVIDPTHPSSIALQTANKTCHYVFAPGLPYSDAQDQAWRTFPLDPEMEGNTRAVDDYSPGADNYLMAVADNFDAVPVGGQDQFYVGFCLKEVIC